MVHVSAPIRRPRILIGLMEHFGDIVACEPVARYLKINHPTAQLIWAVAEPYRELIDSNPFIDETLVLPCLTDWMRLTSHCEYDLVCDLHVNYRVCAHCRIPLAKKHGNPFVTAYDWLDHGPLLEAFALGAGLPRLSAQPEVYLGQEHVDAVDGLALPPRFCVIHRTSNEASKDWTDKRWLDLCTYITSRLGHEIIEVGAGKPPMLPRPLEGTTNFVNRLSILQTAEVIRRARFFVGVDSGPAHLANALRIPGVLLLGRHAGFRSYTPYTGFYASASPFVKIVRNGAGPTADLTAREAIDAVRYVATAIDEQAMPRVAGLPSADNLAKWGSPETPDSQMITASGLFDAGWYALQDSAILQQTRHPADHYLETGWRNELSPGPAFSSAAYLACAPDAASGELNPLVRFLTNAATDTRYVPVMDRGPSQFGGEAVGKFPSGIDAFLGVHDDWRSDLAQSKTAREAGDKAGMPMVLAFYLPQFHPIPENDQAHGPGFSEWHNIVKAKPLFTGHRQPRVPGELGFYDLRSEDVIRAQVRLAQEHGISGFCFYYYYFAGRRLLEKPLEIFLNSDIDAPFMCLWANENWTKRWDGGDREVIIEQHHSNLDDLLAIRELLPLFADRRYVKVDGKPVLLIYKAHLFPDIRQTTDTWRAEIERQGLSGIYLVMVDDWLGGEPIHPRSWGFDASYEIPSNRVPEDVLETERVPAGLDAGFAGRIVNYAKFAAFHAARPFPEYSRFRTVMLPWDNTPRYGLNAMIHLDEFGEHYRLWLMEALLDTVREHASGQRFVFIHSWNEWCEGTYLEPDAERGRFFLEETRKAIDTVQTALSLSHRRSTEQLATDLLRIQRMKDAGALHTVWATRMQAHHAHRDVTHFQNESAVFRQRVAVLERDLGLLLDRHWTSRQAEEMLDAIQKSTFWRLTWPLRKIVEWMRKI